MTEPDAETPATSASAPRWRGRLHQIDWRAKARWFGAEYLIIVLGVLTAVGINAWWGDRQDAAKEQTYLRQLAADLAETERIVAERDDRMAVQTHAGFDRLLSSFDAVERPPADSVAAWLRQSLYVASPLPVLGTAEALVATGDLGLIADDSLRAAVLRYLDVSREAVVDQTAAKEGVFDLLTVLYRDHVDIRALGNTSARASADSVNYVFGPIPALSPGPSWRPPYPLDVDALYDDPEFYRLVGIYATFVGELARGRMVMRESATALRRQVEAQID